jgi:cytochrome P450
MERARRRYGGAFTMRIFGLGSAVVVSDPALVKQVFRAPPHVLHAGTQSPLRPILGRHSLLGIDEDEHLQQRKLLLPPFKGQRMKAYESTIAEIAAAEVDRWPDGAEIAMSEPMQRITLRAILRAVFGAEGARLERLERLLGPWTELGSRLSTMVWLQRALGPRSPWGRFLRLRADIDAGSTSSSPSPRPTPPSGSAPTCWRCSSRPATTTAGRWATRRSATSSSPCSPPATRRPRTRCRGPSSA